MNTSVAIRALIQALLVFTCGGPGGLAQPDGLSLANGTTVALGGYSATVKKVDGLPYVESEFTRRFKFDHADNPKLLELRQRYQLDAVVAPGQDEFDRQVLLLDWVHHRFETR